MWCVRPALQKKPSRGFAWACALCNRAQERKLEARRTPIVGDSTQDADEDEIPEEEEDENAVPQTTAPSPTAPEDRPATEGEIAHAKMWTMRYLGMHCRVEEALQYDDRAIYPRASSRLGPKHQAVTSEWYGQPIQFVKPVEIKRKFVKAPGQKKDTKLSRETLNAIEADRAEKAKRPKWVEDEPQGYIRRGEDLPEDDPNCTSKLIFTLPEDDENKDTEEVVDSYMERTKEVAKQLKLDRPTVDFMDLALIVLRENNFDADAAIEDLKKTNPTAAAELNTVDRFERSRLAEEKRFLREPALLLDKDEQRRFGEGVKLFGSELYRVRHHVRTKSPSDIVRYYYYWKYTPKGREIWNAYPGRKNAKKRKAESETTKLLDDIADQYDDSAFDNDKIEYRSRKMVCKHCNTTKSRIWRRAPNVSPSQSASGESKAANKRDQHTVALCDRCARLWRRYSIEWENPDDIGKKVASGGGRAWKRKVDEELLEEWRKLANTGNGIEPHDADSGYNTPNEPVKKKPRLSGPEAYAQEPTKKKVAAPPLPPPPPPRPPTPPMVPMFPKMRDLPCAVCESDDAERDALLVCRDCRLTVHRKCYGIPELRSNKWSCDMCSNDRKESASLAGSSMDPASYEYNCILCPVHVTQRELVEPPRVSHKKKNDHEKEKERIERELATKLGEQYRQQQKDQGRPQLPREALKRTADNNWVHVSCALFTPEIKFSNAKSLEAAEGVPLALRQRKGTDCKICKESMGATISCFVSNCNNHFHVPCAVQAGCKFGFDVTPVKNSRRDSVAIVTLSEETGALSAAVYCLEHSAQTKFTIHSLNEVVNESGMTAVQAFAQYLKQADLTLTGTARKANLLDDFTKLVGISHPKITENRRASATGPAKHRGSKDGNVSVDPMSPDLGRGSPGRDNVQRCGTCGNDVSPKWWPHPAPSTEMTNGIKRDIHHSRENSLRVDSMPHLNGNGHQAVLDSVEHSSDNYECNRCHWRRINPTPPSEDAMDVDEPVETPAPSPPSRPQAPTVPAPVPAPAQPTWGSLASIPAQPPTHGTWPPQPAVPFSAPPVHASPPPVSFHSHHAPAVAPYRSPSAGHPPPAPHSHAHAPPPPPPPHHGPAYLPPVGPSSHGPPSHGLPSHGAPSHGPHRQSYGSPVMPPIHGLHQGLPNGVPLQHSPTRQHQAPPPPPLAHLPPRQEPNYNPPPPVAHMPFGGHHHGSPVAPNRPTPPAPNLPQNRPAHGASASPSVRNLLTD
jgi:hypothetical protein